jgi:hypothetical protein
LLSVNILAKRGLTTIFSEKGCHIYKNKDENAGEATRKAAREEEERRKIISEKHNFCVSELGLVNGT